MAITTALAAHNDMLSVICVTTTAGTTLCKLPMRFHARHIFVDFSLLTFILSKAERSFSCHSKQVRNSHGLKQKLNNR